MVQSTLERALNFFNRILETGLNFAPWLWIAAALLALGLGLYALDKTAFAKPGTGSRLEVAPHCCGAVWS